MVKYKDVRIVKREFKGGAVQYATQANYQAVLDGVTIDDWRDESVKPTVGSTYTSLASAQDAYKTLLDKILVSETVIEPVPAPVVETEEETV